MNFDIFKASGKLSLLDLKITSGNLSINVLWFRAAHCSSDAIIERHTHSAFEFHFIYSGSGTVELDNGSFSIQAGEFYLAAPGVFHRQLNHKGYIELCLNCELNYIEESDSEAKYIIDVLKKVGCRPVADTTGLTDIFGRALEEAHYQNAGFYNNIRSLTIMLITSSVRAITGQTPAQYAVPVKHKKDDYRFIQIRNYILDNISLPITTMDISHYMFLSGKQISRIVKEASGMTAKELIQEIKFQEAKKMLIERQDLTARQIAELLGFSSEFYFSQFFKRKEGYPPRMFRMNVQ